MGFLSILSGGGHDIRPASDWYFTGDIESTLSKQVTVDLPDFSETVKMLWADEYKVWQSSHPGSFKKDGKINFLHLSPDGVFALTIIKPGSKTILTAKIPQENVWTIREKLKEMKDWDKNASAETWDKADGDKDGNTYIFNRYLTLLEDESLIWKLQWEWRHKNRWNTVEVRDSLRFIKMPPIILPKR